MNDRCQARLLFHAEGEASWNMAVDQAIAESIDGNAIESGAAVPTLRFYTWKAPTLSLGYFQSAADVENRFEDLTKVRRSTGGGAIVHDQELTYSLTMPSPAGQHGARHDLYLAVHRSIASVLKLAGIDARPYRQDVQRDFEPETFLCFRRRTDEDLIVNAYKICGSAQRRSKRAILQHGSLLLRTSRHAPELPGLYELTSTYVDPLAVSQQIAQRLGDELQLTFEESILTADEDAAAKRIRSDRFDDPQWWSRR